MLFMFVVFFNLVTPSSSLNVSVLRSPYSSQPTVSASSYQTSIITSSRAQSTTITPITDNKKMEGHVIIIIATVSAIALFTIAIVVLICIFRRLVHLMFWILQYIYRS